jgi:hypothetical protein
LTIRGSLISGHISHLPATPEIFAELRQCLSDTDNDIQRIIELIGRDPALTARFIQIANSAWFTRGPEVTISRVPYPSGLEADNVIHPDPCEFLPKRTVILQQELQRNAFLASQLAAPHMRPSGSGVNSRLARQYCSAAS